jgi:hypothetical protein
MDGGSEDVRMSEDNMLGTGVGRDPVVRSETGLQTGLWSGPRSVWSVVS